MPSDSIIKRYSIPSLTPPAPNVNQINQALKARRHMIKASKERLIEIYKLRAETETPLFDKPFLDHNHTLMG